MDKELPDRKGVLVDTYGSAEFSRDVIRQFPSLQSDLEEDAGLLHVQMGTLGGSVRQAIASGDLALPLQVCRFLGEILARKRLHPEIENAVAISFVDAKILRESDAGRQLLDQMPKRVREVLLDQERRDETA